MKFKTFRALVLGGLAIVAAAAAAGAYVACRSDDAPSGGGWRTAPVHANPEPRPATPSPGRPATAGQPAPAAANDPLALRPLDRRVLDRVKQGIAGDKVKDAFKSESYKVNLYREEGKVRVKIDLDRDEKWDEKWDFESEGGQEIVKRKVATRDDENYDQSYRLAGDRWQKE